MNKKKRINVIEIVFILFVGTFQACTYQQQTKEFKIGFSQCTEGDAWRQAMHIEMEREMSLHPNLTLEIRDAKNQNDIQIQDIKYFLKKKVDLLIVSPNEAAPITPIIEEAFNTNTPVIIIDRKTTSNQYTAYIGADNYEIGKLAGNYVANLLKGKGKIIEIWGLTGSSPAIERSRGFREVIKQYPDLEITHRIQGKWLKNVAEQQLVQNIKLAKEADLIFAHNDQMALGAYETLKAAGIEQKIKFIGIDALSGPRGGMQMVEDKVLHASVLYPTGGDMAIRTAVKVLKKNDFNKENILQTTIIDSSNVRVMQLQTSKILSQQKDIEQQERYLKAQIALYRNQRNLLYVMVGSLILSLILALLAWKALRAKQKANAVLRKKNQEIIQQRNQIKDIAEEARSANEAKFKFFTNISHEFRTPLTLIISPIEEILNAKKKLSHTMLQDIMLIRKNAYRLLRLISQLMDFRKIENQKMVLKATENEIVSFVRSVKMTFDHVADSRKIDYKLKSNVAKLNVWFDTDKLDKVIFNLLSNAFKFTKDQGLIHLEIQEDIHNQQVIIQIKDNGRGMSPEHVANAFERFYQGEKYSTLGTGLGLSLSKELIQLHKGKISVESEKGKGTCFEIILSLGKQHLQTNELSQLPTEKNVGQLGLVYSEELYSGVRASSQEVNYLYDKSLLLIEDNPDLVLFLKDKLTGFASFYDEKNGNDGLNTAFEKVPDIIICDVKLPGLDGLSITHQLKNDLRTSHIPIILLTANDTQEEQIKGMKSGADTYIIKPFNFGFLLENIKSLLDNRQKLKDRYSAEIIDENTSLSISPLDKKLLNDFMACVNKNISEPGFQVEDICREVGLSRVQLYRKIKSLTDYSPTDYIKEVRLKKAIQLMKEQKLSITQIAYEVGFTSPAYFSTSFKAKYQSSPSEYKSQLLSGNH